MTATRYRSWIILIILPAVVAGALAPESAAEDSLSAVVESVQPKLVKLYGAGGVRGLEPYQSGFLISDTGHILTAWSYVLDTDYVTATLDDGRKFEAKLVSFDPRLEVAVLKIEAAELPHFDLAAAVGAMPGSRVLALSNLFGVATGDEAASVQHGVIAVRTKLDARRGTFETPYHGDVYVLDAMTNNPGAAGGVLINQYGELLGLLGKELRSAQNNIWLNYALPIDQLRESVEAILAGKSPRVQDDAEDSKPDNPAQLATLGIVLVPDVLERTPPYVDAVRPKSPADVAGIKPDDLVVYLGENLIPSCKSLVEEVGRIEHDVELRFVLMRGQELMEVVVTPVVNEQAEPE